jgi:hypothetical protein
LTRLEIDAINSLFHPSMALAEHDIVEASGRVVRSETDGVAVTFTFNCHIPISMETMDEA